MRLRRLGLVYDPLLLTFVTVLTIFRSHQSALSGTVSAPAVLWPDCPEVPFWNEIRPARECWRVLGHSSVVGLGSLMD